MVEAAAEGHPENLRAAAVGAVGAVKCYSTKIHLRQLEVGAVVVEGAEGAEEKRILIEPHLGVRR